MTVADAAADLPGVPRAGWTGGVHYSVLRCLVGGIVCIAASNGGTTSQDLKTGFLVGATPRLQQIAILIGATASALVLGPVLLGLNNTATVYVPAAQVAPGLRAPDAETPRPTERLSGPQARTDTTSTRCGTKQRRQAAHPASTCSMKPAPPCTSSDPGINGLHPPGRKEPRSASSTRPKHTLMSYIIKGILDQKLPWALVLFGVMTLSCSSERHPFPGVCGGRVTCRSRLPARF